MRIGVPGTPLDGDGDGVPGGVNNFWFQTRPLNRTLEFHGQRRSDHAGPNDHGRSAPAVSRGPYEFVPDRQDNRARATLPFPIATAPPDSRRRRGNLAAALQTSINSRRR